MRWISLLPGLCLASGCILSVRPLSDDFSDLPPEEALDRTLGRLEGVYSFTDWKALDWGAVRAALEAEAAEAQSVEDWERIWRRLVLAMPDGHVSLWSDEAERDLCPEARGGLGLDLAPLDSGELVVTAVAAGGPAAAAGVLPGDLLRSRDGLGSDEALAAAPLHCSPVGLATHERRRVTSAHLLGRAPAGEEVSLELLDSAGQSYAVTLSAAADGAGAREVLSMPAPEARVSARMWTDDVGYVRIGWEETVLSERLFRDAVSDLWSQGARALVVDLRDNDGGTDQTAANIAGVFYQREAFYETITMYDRRTEGQVAISEVYVEPQPLLWELPAAALVNGNTISSGEGIAMMLARLEAVEVIGFEGTAASFGSAGSTIRLPDGWELSYPAGRSLDAGGQIQLDSDDTLEGGVAPEHRLPWTAGNRLADAADPEGFLVDYAAARLAGGGR
jgi:carboxyl-terminal processing protease